MIQNLRDLGGLRTVSGKTIKRGCFVRSANLSQAEDADLAGVSEIIDLRTTRERIEVPDRSCGRTSLPIPIFDEAKSGISHEKKVERKGPPDMGALYKWMIRDHRDSFTEVLTAILRHDYASGAILWHCTEGKDRCGLTAALLLELLGVDRMTIMEDYLKTNEVNIPKAEAIRERLRAERGDEVAESVYRAFIADRAYLEGAWAEMDAQPDFFGSLGLPKADIERFKVLVLE
ncbi:MAG: tyrosine-protein phosphatase [Lachnospiraceae bacterium]|nr:tyrosine-protein phosphatase [Lachnospiraceae bacterium]